MKFATVLRNSAEELPDAAELFTLYKHLKKSLKRIPCGEGYQDDSSLVGELPSGSGEAGSGDDELTELVPGSRAAGPEVASCDSLTATERASLDEGEQAFVAELTRDVVQLNEQYMEKEEINVIRFGELKDELEAASSPEELLQAHRALVDFHGELLLVLHWSVLAYTGLVKILKKHHKRTGVLLRAPHLTNMLGQPFCSVEVTVGMICEVEGLVRSLAGRLGADSAPDQTSQQAQAPGAVEGVVEQGHENDDDADTDSVEGPTTSKGQGAKRPRDEKEDATPPSWEDGTEEAQLSGDNSVLRRTRAALGLWRQLQLTASSPSTVLPGTGSTLSGLATQVGSVTFGSVPSGLTDGSSA